LFVLRGYDITTQDIVFHNNIADRYGDLRHSFIDTFHTAYDCVESCTDEREHAGDCIETVIMKNTGSERDQKSEVKFTSLFLWKYR